MKEKYFEVLPKVISMPNYLYFNDSKKKHAQYKLGLKFLHTWKTIKDSFLSKIYKTTFVDLFTLSNFASIHFFLKLCQLGDNWAEKNFGKYPTVEKRGWGGSVTIPPDQCSLI